MRNLIQQGLALRELLRERILILDGAMGTMLQQVEPHGRRFRRAASRRLQRKSGDDPAGCGAVDSQEIPRRRLGHHRDELLWQHAGRPRGIRPRRPGSRDQQRAAELARKAADEFSTAAKPRFVAGSMGPTTKAISVTGGITFEELRKNFFDQAKGLIEGGADLLLLETCQDTRNIKAGALAIDELSREIGQPIPVMVSVTIEPMGTMLAGQNIEALWASLDHAGRSVAGAELRHGAGVHDGSRPHAAIAHDPVRFLLSQCWAAERGRAVPGNAHFACRAARPVRRARMAEYRGWVLRNHRKAHSRHRADGRVEEAAATPAVRAIAPSTPELK